MFFNNLPVPFLIKLGPLYMRSHQNQIMIYGRFRLLCETELKGWQNTPFHFKTISRF